MTESEYWYHKSNQDKLYSDLQHETIMNAAMVKYEMAVFESLKPMLTKDGNKWLCLLGENIQEGIFGFGDTPYLAILDFNKNFNQP